MKRPNRTAQQSVNAVRTIISDSPHTVRRWCSQAVREHDEYIKKLEKWIAYKTDHREFKIADGDEQFWREIHNIVEQRRADNG